MESTLGTIKSDRLSEARSGLVSNSTDCIKVLAF